VFGFEPEGHKGTGGLVLSMHTSLYAGVKEKNCPGKTVKMEHIDIIRNAFRVYCGRHSDVILKGMMHILGEFVDRARERALSEYHAIGESVFRSNHEETNGNKK